MSDWTGRRPVLGLADIIFIGGAIAQSVCHDVWSMVSLPRSSNRLCRHLYQIGGRFLIGVGVGLASCIAPLYIQELSPTRLRGRMVVLNVVMITLGQVIAYGIGAGFANVGGGWRWMVGLGAVPAALQLFFLFFLPESREHSILFLSDMQFLIKITCSSYISEEGAARCGSGHNGQDLRVCEAGRSRPQSWFLLWSFRFNQEFNERFVYRSKY